ncbi:MAG: sigma-70 family RNA polymerase sigma factor [Myxococcota bacterium]
MAELNPALELTLRRERPRIVASVLPLCGSLDLAEDAVHEAALAAIRAWAGGVPSNPAAWLTTVARRVALDAIRHRKRAAAHLEELAFTAVDHTSAADPVDVLVDDYLRLLFTCCDPALGLDSRIALTLKVVVGFSTAEIARAFLTSENTISQRILRAKRTIHQSGRGYEPPTEAELPARVGAVLGVVYALINEGHTASDGQLTRSDLLQEALRLGHLLGDLMPEHPEVFGLVALAAFTSARSRSVDGDGAPVLLAQQDRAQWDRRLVREGLIALHRARSLGRPGPYVLQAEIAAVHITAPSWEDTDWDAVVKLYDALVHLQRSPVVALNRAIALSMRDGAPAGLDALSSLESNLEGYHLFFAARAELLERVGRDGRADLRRALELVTNDPDRRLLERRLRGR